MLWTILIALYGLLVGIGGIIGYIKAGSRVSLMTGLGSAVALGVAAYANSGNRVRGLLVAILIAIALTTFFGLRWRETRKFMPAGLMTLLSAVAAIAFAVGVANR
ncbi:TMEM14 family protein [Cyanobacteria bacterium FACHB-DQ100]|nr:TMEM14 family protein [Cyanobacteria bacterium FACHB-DQ100]